MHIGAHWFIFVFYRPEVSDHSRVFTEQLVQEILNSELALEKTQTSVDLIVL